MTSTSCSSRSVAECAVALLDLGSCSHNSGCAVHGMLVCITWPPLCVSPQNGVKGDSEYLQLTALP